MNDFGIKINEFDSISYKFGVYSGEVVPPSTYICRKNEKMFSRFFYVQSGKIIFNKGTKEQIIAGKGDILYLPKDITYTSEWNISEKGKYISVNFNHDDFYVRFPNKICIAAKDKYGVYFEMFAGLLDVWNKGELGYELEVLSGVYKIMHRLFCDITYKRIKNKNSIIYKGIVHLENHYLEDIGVTELAAMCNTSESNFRKLFARYKSMPPVTYRNYLRIKKAVTLIETGEYNVREAAEAVNIPDINYFHKLFKHFIGITPGELKNRTNT